MQIVHRVRIGIVFIGIFVLFVCFSIVNGATLDPKDRGKEFERYPGKVYKKQKCDSPGGFFVPGSVLLVGGCKPTGGVLWPTSCDAATSSLKIFSCRDIVRDYVTKGECISTNDPCNACKNTVIFYVGFQVADSDCTKSYNYWLTPCECQYTKFAVPGITLVSGPRCETIRIKP